MKILMTVTSCLSYFSIAMIKLHDQGYFQKEMHLIWGSQLRGLESITITARCMAASKHGTGTINESALLNPQAQ